MYVILSIREYIYSVYMNASTLLPFNNHIILHQVITWPLIQGTCIILAIEVRITNYLLLTLHRLMLC